MTIRSTITKSTGLLFAPDGLTSRCSAFVSSLTTFSSVGSNILAADPSDRITGDIDPSFLRWTEEQSQFFICNELVKDTGINIVIVKIFILHMNNHLVPSSEMIASLYSLHVNNRTKNKVSCLSPNRQFFVAFRTTGTLSFFPSANSYTPEQK